MTAPIGTAVAFDAYTLGANGGAGNWSHTNTGSDRALLAFVLATASVSSVTYDGVAMTNLVNYLYAGAYPFAIYGLINPSIGTHNVVVTTAGAVYASSTSFTGVASFGSTSAAQPNVVSSTLGDAAVMVSTSLDTGFVDHGPGPLGGNIEEGWGSPTVTGANAYLGVNLVGVSAGPALSTTDFFRFV